MAFKILVDTKQMRAPTVGVSTLVGAQDWDPAWCLPNNCFVDGVTGTAMLLPAAFDPTNWQTSNAGIYAKLPPSDFTLSPGSGWLQVQNNSDGSSWLKYPNNTGGAKAITTYNVAENQALVLQFFINPGTASTDPVADVGWGASGDYTTGVALRIYAGLTADVYKDGTFINKGTLAGQNPDYGQTDGQVASQAQSQYVTIVLIPCRQRELLILSSNGGGFSVIFDDIAEGTSSPVITPSAPVWFGAPPGVDTTWQLALCQYKASGNAIGKRSYFRYDPGAAPTGGFQKWLDQDLEGCTTAATVADGVNPFAAYANNTNGVRMRVALTGTTVASGPYTPTITPFLYGTRGYTLPQLATTSDTPLDIISFAMALSIDMGDAVSGTRARLHLKDPKAIIAAGIAADPVNKPGFGIDWQHDRPIQIWDDDDNQIFEGIVDDVDLEEGTVIGSTGAQTYGTVTNRNEFVNLSIRDLWYLLENCVFEDPIPLDGLTLLQAFTMVTDYAGVTDSTNSLGLGVRAWNMSTAIASYVLPKAGNVTNSDFNVMIEPGDLGSYWVDRLFKTYCANAFIDLVPMNGWAQPTLLLEADLPATPAVTLYDSEATAIAHGVATPSYLQIFRKVNLKMLKPEADDIYVQGKDYRLQRPILSHHDVPSDIDPTTIPASRAPSWRGQRISYSWNDPNISTQQVCNDSNDVLFARLTIARSMGEFEFDFKSLLRRGKLVKLYFATGGGMFSATDGTKVSPATARIKSVSASFVYTANDDFGMKWRPTRYVIQNGTDASILNSEHTDLKRIAADWLMRAFSKNTQLGDANDKNLWRRPLTSQDSL